MLSNVHDTVKRLVPILQWLPQYNIQNGVSDLIAGITVGLTLIPQSLAYASIAGLSPEYGLYSSICGGIVYAIFGTMPQVSIAPSALLSLLTFSYTHKSSYGAAQAAIMLCFLSGIAEIGCGLLKLGFLIDFVSAPVVSGFTSAGAVIAASAQAKSVLGLSFVAENVVDVWSNVFSHIQNTNKWDAILSLCCCIILLGLRELGKRGSPPVSSTKKTNDTHVPVWKIVLWLISVSRNAILVVACSSLAFVLENHGAMPFTLTNKVNSGLPSMQLPSFTITTQNSTFAFTDIIRDLGSGVFIVPFVGILGNIAIAKAFAQGMVVDASQEMLALGLCNTIGSLFGSMPVNASFSRGAVSNASGIKTTMGGVYTGLMVLFALTFLTPYFPYIPRATLASVILCAVLFMVDVEILKPIWKINKIDWIPLWGTFVTCLLFGMEVGILIGVTSDVILLLYYNARPKITTEKLSGNGVSYVKVTPASAVLFPSAEYIREAILKTSIRAESNVDIIVLDCSHLNKADYTSAKCISLLSVDLKENKKSLILLKASEKLTKCLTRALTVKPLFVEREDQLLQAILELQEKQHSNINNHTAIEIVPMEAIENNCVQNSTATTEC